MPRIFRWSFENGFEEEPEGISAGVFEAHPDLRDAPCLAFLPPIWDHHGHVYWYGALLEQADLRGASSPEEALQRLRTAEKSLPEGVWLEGFGWDQNLWGGNYPTRSSLDVAFPSRPVYLRRIDGHAAWVNGAALASAGVTDRAGDPDGGCFLRERGRLTGILLDRAMERVAAAIPAVSGQSVERRIRAALTRLKAYGLSGVTDMGLEPEHAEALRRLDEAGALPIPVEGHFWIRDGETDPGEPFEGRDFRMTGCKFFADGALGSRGAALFEPYSDDPANAGLLLWDAPSLARKVREVRSRGFTPAIHAIGDRANAVVIEALEAAGCAEEARIEHAQVLRDEELATMSRLKVTASIQPCHYLSDAPWAHARLGRRMTRAYRAGSLARAGVKILAGTDFPIEEPDPTRTFFSATAREPESERLGLAQLLRACAPPPFLSSRALSTIAVGDSAGALLAGSPRLSRFKAGLLGAAP